MLRLTFVRSQKTVAYIHTPVHSTPYMPAALIVRSTGTESMGYNEQPYGPE